MTKVIASSMSGPLEIFYYRGKKMLGTKNTSYSYGPVQSVWLDVLRRVKLKENKRTLILGLGGGTILKLIREKWKYTGKVVGVEIDPVIIDIARREFGIRENKQTKIVEADGFNYVRDCTEKFDCIFIDIFIDNKLPRKAITKIFWRRMRNVLEPGGTILFNIYNRESDMPVLEKCLAASSFSFKLLKNMGNSNAVLVIR